MITIKEFPDKQFQNKEDMFKELRENKNTLIAQKKMITKEADAISYCVIIENEKGETTKADAVRNRWRFGSRRHRSHRSRLRLTRTDKSDGENLLAGEYSRCVLQ